MSLGSPLGCLNGAAPVLSSVESSIPEPPADMCVDLHLLITPSTSQKMLKILSSKPSSRGGIFRSVLPFEQALRRTCDAFAPHTFVLSTFLFLLSRRLANPLSPLREEEVCLAVALRHTYHPNAQYRARCATGNNGYKHIVGMCMCFVGH